MNECPLLAAHSHEVVAYRPDGKARWVIWYVSVDGRTKTWAPLSTEWACVDRCLGAKPNDR